MTKSAGKEEPTLISAIPYTKPSITQLEVDFVIDAVRNGWGDSCYNYIYNFQDEIKLKLGVSHAIATSSCTGALTLALSALGVGVGDEVILADTNWVASLSPILHAGATPVFADVDAANWCLTKNSVEESITDRTKAIIVTHLYGNLAPIAEIAEIASSRGIFVIEDAAEALGSQAAEKHAGTFGDVGVFSLHGTKTVTSGEGAFAVTNNPEIAEKIETLNNHGRMRSEHISFTSSLPGYKFKISNIQAALAQAQMLRLDELVARKREVFRLYEKGLLGFCGALMNPEPPGAFNSFWIPTFCLPRQNEGCAQTILKLLWEDGVQARPFFPPLSSLVFVNEVPRPTSASLHSRAINLPSFHEITSDEIEYVIEKVKVAVLKVTGEVPDVSHEVPQ